MSRFTVGDEVNVFNMLNMIRPARGIIKSVHLPTYTVSYFPGESPTGLATGRWTAPYITLAKPVELFEGGVIL